MGKDFNSEPFNITIKAGSINGSANISITCDGVMEGMETFNISLKLATDNPQVLIDKNEAMIQIVDSTGKQVVLIVTIVW